jgi:hypothetical protein
MKSELGIWHGNSEKKKRWCKGYGVVRRRRCGSWPPRQKKQRGKDAERVRPQGGKRPHAMLLLLEEAEEAAEASEDAIAKHKRAKYSLERRRLQKEKHAAEEELERVRILYHVEQERVHSNVLGLRQEREEAVEERVRVELGKEVEAVEQREKIAALRVAELEEQQRDMSLMGICRKVLPREELTKLQNTRFNLNSFGDSSLWTRSTPSARAYWVTQ